MKKTITVLALLLAGVFFATVLAPCGGQTAAEVAQKEYGEQTPLIHRQTKFVSVAWAEDAGYIMLEFEGKAPANLPTMIVGYNTFVLKVYKCERVYGPGFLLCHLPADIHRVPNLEEVVFQVYYPAEVENSCGENENWWSCIGIEVHDDQLWLGENRIDVVRIGKVVPDTPAAKHGLLAGDAIISIDGTRTNNSEELQRLLSQTESDSILRFALMRDGEPWVFEVEAASTVK